MPDRRIEDRADTEAQQQLMVRKGASHGFGVGGQKHLAAGGQRIVPVDVAEALAAADRVRLRVRRIEPLHLFRCLHETEHGEHLDAHHLARQPRHRLVHSIGWCACRERQHTRYVVQSEVA